MLSRLTVATADVQLYLVPARGWMCLVDQDGLGTCNRTDEARKGYLIGRTSVSRGYLVRGAVPDGTDSVTVSGAAGKQEAPVESNGWSAAVTFEPSSVSYTDAGGAHEIPVYSPPVK
jgi:hypothetical protein